MKTLAFLLLGCSVCWGQTPDECRPSSLNIPGAQYPCVYPDHRATFRLLAPDAQKVQVRVGKDFDMTKGADGAWTVTTTPLVEGFHYYSLVVDGAQVADPATETFFGSGWENSAIEIPETGVDYYSAEGRAARPGEPAVVLLQGHRQVAALLRLHAAGLRHTGRRAIRFSTCCTAGARTRRAGTSRATRTSSWTT